MSSPSVGVRPNTQKWRWVAWLFSIGTLIAVGLLWSQLDTISDGGAERIGYSVVAWFAMLGAVFCFPTLSGRLQWGGLKPRGPFGRTEVLLIFGAAVIVRLAFWGAPVSDDVNRYLWEGKVVAAGEIPYAAPADDSRWESLRDGHWTEMNHRDRLTAYPPGMELIMAAAGQVWYHPLVFKVVSLIGDLWTLGALVLLASRMGKPARWIGFYAFNPVVLAVFAGEAHFDSWMVAGFLTALLMASKSRWGWAWFWLGFAVQMKLMALVLFPLFWLAGDWRKAWAFLLAIIIPSLLFWQDLDGLVEGLLAFGGESAFNGGFYETLRLIGLPELISRGAGVAVFGLGMVMIGYRLWTSRQPDCGATLLTLSFAALALLVVCSPIVHLWYLAWLVPMLALRPNLSWIVLCGSMAITFLAWENAQGGRGWGYSREIVVASWLPFFLFLAVENRWFWSRLKARRSGIDSSSVGQDVPSLGAALSIDIIVPVYREGEKLAPFLNALKSASLEAGRIIVVDGNPDGRDLATARECGIIAISSGRGRGNQIARGLRETTADLVAVVHADTAPRDNWIPKLWEAARTESAATAFVLGQRFQSCGINLLFIEILNEARASFNGSVFGDQTLIIRRSALEQAGGFPEQPLMEDVEVSWRLLSLGPISYLGEEWEVSARKWQRGFGPRFRQVLGLMIRYRWVRMRGKAAAADFSKKLFREYYPKQ